MSDHDDIELKRAMDALPRSIEPPADLWPALKGRLGKRGRAVQPITGGVPARFAMADSRPAPFPWRIAALLTLLAGSAGALGIVRHQAARWQVAASDGSTRTLVAGDSLATGTGRARLIVGTVGQVEALEETKLRVVKASTTEQRMALTRGTIRAQISAPPRLFIVETPAGHAVDMGCAYTLTVDSSGTSHLVVTAGWVEMVNGTTALIPAGMHVTMHPNRPVDTPVMDDADPEFERAILRYDSLHSDTTIFTITRLARAKDAVTLWHLVDRTPPGPRRALLLNRLVTLVPLPRGVTRGALDHGGWSAMQLYWQALPGTLPIMSPWQAALWRLWLRIAG